MKTPLVGEFERAGPFDQRKRPFGAQLDRNVELPAAFKFLVELGKIPRLPGDQIARQAGEIGFDPFLANSLDPADRGDLAIVEDPGAILAGGADQLAVAVVDFSDEMGGAPGGHAAGDVAAVDNDYPRAKARGFISGR